MVRNCCTALVHVLRLVHWFIHEPMDNWVAADGKQFLPVVARRLWAQMLFQYLCDVQRELPRVEMHFARGGAVRFAVAFREACRVGAEESTSYHELAMQLARRMLTIIRSCIGAPYTPVPREDFGILDPTLPRCIVPPQPAETDQLAAGFCSESADAVVPAIARNFGPIREAFASDRVFSRFTGRHWQRLFNMTQKEAALVPEAHSTTREPGRAAEEADAAMWAFPAEGRRPLATFISYSHEDSGHRKRLNAHLAPLTRGVLAIWHDEMINPGEEWIPAILDKLEKADLILLLVSADFLASKFCYDREVRRAFERHKRGTGCVMPIIVGPCDWKSTPLATLQALPKDGKPIATWANQDEAWLDVVDGIRRAAATLLRPEGDMEGR